MQTQSEDIKVIRDMMERSSKFLSLSGLSGIVAGIAALAGSAYAYFKIFPDHILPEVIQKEQIQLLLCDAIIVLVISLIGALLFSWTKARKDSRLLYGKTTSLILYTLAVPLVAGGIFTLIFLLRGHLIIAVCGTLIFYGLALVNASKYTFREIHYLGLTEIIFGLAAALYPQWGIIWWSVGFGLCHIVYGTIMYIKYDRKK